MAIRTGLRAAARSAVALLITAVIAACSGSSEVTPAASPAAVTMSLSLQSLPDALDRALATPSFHAAPVLLDEPDDVDRADPTGSAEAAPHMVQLPAGISAVPTRRLTVDAIERVHRESPQADTNGEVSPLGGGTAVATYTPAQIRAAYGLPAMPAAGATPSALQAAQLGAGQTIYLVDAHHDPNAAAELAAFVQKFGLPACTTRTIAPGTTLPLPAASTTACEFSVVYSTPAGTMTGSAPAYDSGWATEIAIDVEWAHATAPLARIVLIEAPDATTTSLAAAVGLANAMGPGVVSMSFGASEGSWTPSYDHTFSSSQMTYVAATGDAGAGVEWPSVSSYVVGVGGTSLTYSGSGTRTETAWSSTGGGISAYVPIPSYQTSGVPGLSGAAFRHVADVAFNADPNTGQYVAVMAQGGGSANWLSAGGTSLATPQWAGVFTIVNAVRALSSAAPIGAPHPVLYAKVGTTPASYAADFADVTQGSDGGCATCKANTGYDTLTGLGTPNASALVASLTNVAGPPSVAPVSVTGTVGVPLSFTLAVASPHPVAFSLAGAPSGMTVSSTGVVSWAAPMAGKFTFTATATDATTRLAATATCTVTVSAPQAPTVTAASISGNAGTPLSYAVSFKATGPASFTLAGAPPGLTISSVGILSWSSPVQGSYKTTVTVKDASNGLTGQGVITITIAAAIPPSVAGAAISGIAGTSLSFTAKATAVDPVTWSLGGAPAGMTINGNGVVTWASPVAGSYSVSVTATDSRTALSGRGTYTITILKPGPAIAAAPIKGVAGKPLTATIAFSDPTSGSLSVQISGIPAGMSFVLGQGTITATWPSPATGNYSLAIKATDGAGLTTTATVPVTITTH